MYHENHHCGRNYGFSPELNQAWEAEQARRRRFHEEMTEEQKAEFIQGEVVIHSPVRKKHNEITRRLVQMLGLYCTQHQLGFVGFEKILIRLTRNDYDRSGEPP